MEIEAQDREASLKDGTPGRVLGRHQPEFSFGMGRGRSTVRACVGLRWVLSRGTNYAK